MVLRGIAGVLIRQVLITCPKGEMQKNSRFHLKFEKSCKPCICILKNMYTVHKACELQGAL